jgi:hypothetical protein
VEPPLVILLGLWVTASPDVMGYEGPERLNNHITGPLVVSAAVIAIAETTRSLRWINVGLGSWLILAPVVLHYGPLHIGVRSSLIGMAVAGLSFIGGTRRHELGGGWSRLAGSHSAQASSNVSETTARRLAG